MASRLAGVILVTADASSQKLQWAASNGMPVVLVNRQDFLASCDSVLGNDQKAAYQAVNYLIQAGHRNIALLSSPRTLVTSRNAALGYQTALEANHIPYDESQVYEIDINMYSDALKTRTPFKASRLFAEQPDVSAVICSCNEIAVEFFVQCRQIGVGIPQDLSLVCLDPVQTVSYSEVSFCTFGADQRSLGEAAVQQILRRIETRSKKGGTASSTSDIVLEPAYMEGTSVRHLSSE